MRVGSYFSDGRSRESSADSSQSVIADSGEPGVNTAATPWDSSVATSSGGMIPPANTSTPPRSRACSSLDDLGDQRHVRPREQGQADRVGVLLQGCLGDLFGGLEQARVDHLEAGIAQGAGDDLGAAVVAVQAGLGDDDAVASQHSFLPSGSVVHDRSAAATCYGASSACPEKLDRWCALAVSATPT